MKRRLITLSSLLSLILCIATIVLWIRSYFGSDYISRAKPTRIETHSITHRANAITFTRGCIRLSYAKHTYYSQGSTIPLLPAADPPARWGYGRLGAGHLHWNDAPSANIWNRLGFYRYNPGFITSFSDSHEDVIAFPAALPAIVFAIHPLLSLRSFIKRRHLRRAGLCPHCGYDLRATPAQCPECGHKKS